MNTEHVDIGLPAIPIGPSLSVVVLVVALPVVAVEMGTAVAERSRSSELRRSAAANSNAARRSARNSDTPGVVSCRSEETSEERVVKQGGGGFYGRHRAATGVHRAARPGHSAGAGATVRVHQPDVFLGPDCGRGGAAQAQVPLRCGCSCSFMS